MTVKYEEERSDVYDTIQYIIYQRDEVTTSDPHQPMQKLKHQMLLILCVVYNWLFVNLILMLSTDIVRVPVM